jgi:hypothetical protein
MTIEEQVERQNISASEAVYEEPSHQSVALHGNQQQPQTLEQVICAIALNPEIDERKLGMIVNLHNQQVDRERERQFETAYAALQRDLPAVLKSRFNDQTKSKYSTLDDIQKAINPVLDKHGFSIRYESPETQPEGMVVATCVLVFSENGWKVNNTRAIPVDNIGIKGNANKTAAHGTGSAATYARRYALCELLNINLTEDDDGNAAGGEPRVSKLQQRVLLELYEDAPQHAKEYFTQRFPDFKDVPVKDYNAVMTYFKQETAKANEASHENS